MNQKRKKRFVQLVLLIGTITSLFFVPWMIVWAWILPLPNSMDAQLQEAVNHGFEGIVVYVDTAGKPPEFHTAGWHDSYQKIPAKPDALFKIASVSKLYTAVAITKLVQEKRLDLEASLAHYFPELKSRIANADQITIRNLVQHRSGIPNYTNVKDYWLAPPKTAEAKLALILDQPANFKPDQAYEYSNTNYLLLRLLMDKILGYSRQQYIKKEILEPLNLKNTFLSQNEVDINRVMSGYYVGVNADLKTEDYGMLASAQDLGIFLRALNDGTLFKEGEQAIYESIYVYEHTGLVPGYQSIAKYHKDIDTVVIQFTNTTNFSGYHWNVSEIVYSRILKILRKP